MKPLILHRMDIYAVRIAGVEEALPVDSKPVKIICWIYGVLYFVQQQIKGIWILPFQYW